MKSFLLPTLVLTASILIGIVEPSRANPEEAIPGLSIYPKGDVFPFMGYSGIPSRDSKNGFTVTGPDYGAQFHMSPGRRALAITKIHEAGMPTPFFVGLDMHFHDKEKYKPRSDEEIRTEITRQVKELVDDPLLCWWYVAPEEIRFWYKNEINYLKVVTETIRSLDPLHRPIWMYEPNHRTDKALVKTGQYQDILGKGTYTNLAGYHKDRIWVRWSVEQEVNAINSLTKTDDRKRIPLMMPELCRDPENTSDDKLIASWVRHDVYLGLISGAKGVSIWSLFRRPGVKRTWQLWYDAYAQTATELTGELDLGRVFLFGTPSEKIAIEQTSGPTEIKLFVGDRTKLELGTSTKEEIDGSTHTYSLLNFSVFDYKGATYAILCNSHATESVSVSLKSEGHLFALPENKETGSRELTLTPFQVIILKTR